MKTDLYNILIRFQEYQLKHEILNVNFGHAVTAQKFIDSESNLNLEKGEETPVLVGTLNKVFGFNGFKKAEIGTEVYNFKDKYYFEIYPLSEGNPIKSTYYKTDLTPCINFI